jgi:hypothetical protein
MSIHQTTAKHDQIAALAHKFWEDEGRPEGRAEAHWLRATEVLVKAPEAPAAKAAVKAKAPAKKAAKKA